jgi:hypothetical protein
MNSKKVLYTSLLSWSVFALQAQNVGIGEPNPTSKLHVTQTANVDAVFVSQAGTGNAIEVLSNDATNTGSVVWLRNATDGVTLDAYQSNPAATASNILSFNDGLGTGVNIQQRNTGATLPGIFIDQNGNGNFSRGVEIAMGATTIADAQSIYQSGAGGGQYIDIINTTNGIIASAILNRGLGFGQQVDLLNPANASGISFMRTAGIGRGLEIDLNNTNNTQIGLAVFHDGLGIGGYVDANNTAGTNNAVGFFVQYNGSGGGAGGGGNALEVQHNGTNNNAVDILTGDPGLAPGPANTTNEFPSLSISHMATGTSPAVGGLKSAINAINYSEDPTIIAQNQTTTTGAVFEGYITPTNATAAIATSIYGRSDRATPNGYGVGVWGDGGNYGVIGGTSTGAGSSNFGLLSLTNSGAFGIKSFIIDHPFEPTQKNLRHFSVESNEVLNFYRGIVELDANGRATVQLPDYFDAINTNVTYQLTPIGTGVQPYVAVEEANNEFVVAGAPNSKVSWTVHAQRNDPTVRYFEQSSGAAYRQAVTEKQVQDQGKYLVPEAYGQPKEAGIFYDDAREKRAAEVESGKIAKAQKAMPAQERQSVEPQIKQPTKMPKEGEQVSKR